ncbi:MAG TPA: AAA family ATPase, partial [Streptosporangiaceae bacterium]
RLLTWLFWIAVIAVVIGKVTDTNPIVALLHAPTYIWKALPFLLQIFVLVFVLILQFAALFWFLSRGGVDVYYPDDIKTRFADVWGQDHVLARVKENILYLEHPEQVEDRGGYVPGGILLWGPPGTGKTLMAEAVAGETGKPYVFVDPGAFINMFFGVGVLKVKGLFRKLRRLALRYGGVIVFFDEADSLGNRGAQTQGGPGFPRGMTPAPHRAGCHGFSYLSQDVQWLLLRRELQSGIEDEPVSRRSKQIIGAGMGGGGGGGGMGTLQALLTELSGLKKPRGFVNRYVRRIFGMRPKPPPKYRILVMMASNMPEALDEALLRPGRIDRIYKVGYPSKAGRVKTYEGYLAKVRHELTPEQVDKLAIITPYATGATIKDMVNEALITAIRNGRDVINWRDIIRAKQLKELGPPEDVEYIERERHAVAVHEACHALVAYLTRQHMEIDIATIEKGSDYLGMVASIPPEDQFTRWRTEYETDILVSLASLAGERMFFDKDSSSGVSGDLESATTVASFMEGFWGMGSTVSSYSTAKRLEVGAPGGGQGGRKKKGQDPEAELRRALADRIEDSLTGLLARVEELLTQNRENVLCVAHALESHKTLSGDDVLAVLEHRQGPIVDGRPYGDAAFVQRLEEYHQGAAAAHRAHSKAPLSLPAAPSPVWVPQDAAVAPPAPDQFGP